MTKRLAKILYAGFIALILCGCNGEKSDMQKAKHRYFQKSNEIIEQVFARGRQHIEEGEFEKAEARFRSVIDNFPYEFRSYFYLAELHFRLGEDDKAFKVLEEAGKVNTHIDLIIDYLSQIGVITDEATNMPPLPKVSVAQFKDNKICAITFTFDDGYKSVYDKALPLLETFGYRATVCINPGSIKPKRIDPHMGLWEEWKDASERGFEISNHALNHKNLSKVSSRILEEEVNKGYDVIKKKIGKKPMSFMFPFDINDEKSLKKVKERHIAIRDHGTLTDTYENIFIPVYGGRWFKKKTGEQIVNMALKKRLWLIAESHGVLTKEEAGLIKPMPSDFLASHLKYIKENENKIWVDTFFNVYRYLYEKKIASLEYENTGSNEVKITLSAPLDKRFSFAPLTVVINTSPVQPAQVFVSQDDSSESLPVRIDMKKIYVDIMPNTNSVYVKWE